MLKIFAFLILALPLIMLLVQTKSNVVQAQTRSAELKAKLQQQRETLKENFKDTIQQMREEAREQFKAKREAFREKLVTIRDERKKAIVERVDTKMAAVNQKRTDIMSQALIRIEEKLTTLAQKIAEAKASGKDTALSEKALTDAQAALDAAKTAVETQAGKEYIITIDTEALLRKTVGTTVSQLQKDLRATHKAVVEAKQAAQNVVLELAKLGRVTSEGTTSATIPTKITTTGAEEEK
ncbi:MAG: hypothetical protein HY429_03230 [Candidatus Levybacteria bacterium]|nr:hypothetical protein [Candidatus Levybacteria bacterium]